ncbi:MAG: hypothetical protein ABI480_05380 [Chitinophagaceae bacterium]
MKTILFLPLLMTTGFLVRPVFSNQSLYQVPVADSNNIVHVLDGTVKEWPSHKFMMDDGTHIEYAIDNDSKNLYIAMNVSDNRMQIKMMRLGMSTYIDLKGKKKEGRGIEFPEKNEAPENTFFVKPGSRSGQSDDGQQQQQQKPDLKKMRMMMALNMNRLKLFGFEKDEPEDQQLLLPGSVNIAFTWDSTDVMHIEYVVPLALLGDAASLNQKEIGIGWNIHPFEMPKREGGGEGGGMTGGGYGGGGRRGYGGGGGYRGGGGGDAAEERTKMMEAQRFWAKYTVVIPAEKKAF